METYIVSRESGKPRPSTPKGLANVAEIPIHVTYGYVAESFCTLDHPFLKHLWTIAYQPT